MAGAWLGVMAGAVSMETSASLSLDFGVDVRGAVDDDVRDAAEVVGGFSLLPDVPVADFKPAPLLEAAPEAVGALIFAAAAACPPALPLSANLSLAGVEFLGFCPLELFPLPLPLPAVEARACSAAATACCRVSAVRPGRFSGMVMVGGPFVLVAPVPADMLEPGLD